MPQENRLRCTGSGAATSMSVHRSGNSDTEAEMRAPERAAWGPSSSRVLLGFPRGNWKPWNGPAGMCRSDWGHFPSQGSLGGQEGGSLWLLRKAHSVSVSALDWGQRGTTRGELAWAPKACKSRAYTSLPNSVSVMSHR